VLIFKSWYNQQMKKRSPRKTTRGKATGTKREERTIGRDRFAKISEVEGIRLSKAMTARVRVFDRRGSSAEERRTAIIAVYRKS
jgi:hypothetical protein